MSDKNMFEYAAKNKLRFPFRGVVSTEDLYDLSVESLDSIFKTLNTEHKKTEEESLLGKKTKQENELAIKIEIVKHIVNEKLEEVKKRQESADKKKQKAKIMEILAVKQDESLQGKSVEDLQKMLDELAD